jgi:hypothetical protein
MNNSARCHEPFLLGNVGSKCYGNCVFNLLLNSACFVEIYTSNAFIPALRDLNKLLSKYSTEINDKLVEKYSISDDNTFDFTSIYHDEPACLNRKRIKIQHFIALIYEIYKKLYELGIIKAMTTKPNNRPEKILSIQTVGLEPIRMWSIEYILTGNSSQQPADNLLGSFLWLLDLAKTENINTDDFGVIDGFIFTKNERNKLMLSGSFLSNCYMKDNEGRYGYTYIAEVEEIISWITDDFILNVPAIVRKAVGNRNKLICLSFGSKLFYDPRDLAGNDNFAKKFIESFKGKSNETANNIKIKKIKSIIKKIMQSQNVNNSEKEVNLQMDYIANKFYAFLDSAHGTSAPITNDNTTLGLVASVYILDIDTLNMVYEKMKAHNNSMGIIQLLSYYHMFYRDVRIPVFMTSLGKKYRLVGVIYRVPPEIDSINKLDKYKANETSGAYGHYNTVTYSYDNNNELKFINVVDDNYYIQYKPALLDSSRHIYNGIDGNFVASNESLAGGCTPLKKMSNFNRTDEELKGIGCHLLMQDIIKYEQKSKLDVKFTTHLINDPELYYNMSVPIMMKNKQFYDNDSTNFDDRQSEKYIKNFYKSINLDEYLYLNNSYPIQVVYELCDT